MKNLLIIAVVLILTSINALAGVGHDSCIKREKELKSQEADNCSGLKYLLNPSGCFATRKALKEFKAAKCTQIGSSESIDVNTPKVIPQKKINNLNSAVSTDSVSSVAVKKAEPEVPQKENTIEQLKEENTRLKTELDKIRKENEQLRKKCQPQ